MKQQKQALADAFIDGVETLPADMAVASLIGIVAAAPCGLPVVDKRGRYLGVITKTALLETLDRESEAADG